MVATAPRPVAKSTVSGIAFVVSKKAATWADANGYSNLLIDMADFLAKYREANPTNADYYSSHSPEQLMKSIARARQRLDKAMAALSSKNS